MVALLSISEWNKRRGLDPSPELVIRLSQHNKDLIETTMKVFSDLIGPVSISEFCGNPKVDHLIDQILVIHFFWMQIGQARSPGGPGRIKVELGRILDTAEGEVVHALRVPISAGDA